LIQVVIKKVFLIIFCAFLFCPITVKGQDATVYVSPHDIDKTISNIYFSIDRDGHKYITTRHIRSHRSDSSNYLGKLEVIEFEIKDMSKIISCEPTVALETPIKIVIWEEDKDVYIAYTSPYVFKKRYFMSGCDEALKSVNRSLIKIVNQAIRTH